LRQSVRDGLRAAKHGELRGEPARTGRNTASAASRASWPPPTISAAGAVAVSDTSPTPQSRRRLRLAKGSRTVGLPRRLVSSTRSHTG
jgi:hypothetical protein